MTPLSRYLREMRRIHDSGQAVAETSYYAPLAELLNSVGRDLSPPVHCIVTPRDTGAGLPDIGLYLHQQAFEESTELIVPERGVVEAKPLYAELNEILRSPQVGRYLHRYGKVIVTTFREFTVLTVDHTGQVRRLETYTLASSANEFWQAAAAPDRTAAQHEDQLTDFFARAFTVDAPILTPEDLAWFLAAYARIALARIEEKDLPALSAVRSALEETLGVTFEGPKGEHFFRSTLIQTLFYGVFSAWVLWARPGDTSSAQRFQWRQASWQLNVPMVGILFEQIATPSKLGPLGLEEVLDWSEDALNRVARPAFFARFDERFAVPYFYEPFLQAFDPELRKELGVWYTPPEIVTYMVRNYMVRNVDRTLVEELEITDGLADDRVYVLDPCTGTGSYLVEILSVVAERLTSRYGDALVGSDVKHAALQRVFGFEILPAPFVVAHLQLGLLLDQLGATLDRPSGERVPVYLTNALTGWISNQGPQTIPFPELAEERDAAGEVKQEQPILVVIGNPPYNGFAGVTPEEEGELVEPYKHGLADDWNITKNYLDDLYIRFWRIAERRIAEMTGSGIVCFISNFSYLHGPSFVVMRRHLLEHFDKIFVDCMNGDSRETGKTTPEGDPDPSVFSTGFSPLGIQVGTAIGTMIRREDHHPCRHVAYRDFWGARKRTDLLQSLEPPNPPYEVVHPAPRSRFSFRPLIASDDYYTWPQLPDLAETTPMLGLNENRGGTLIDMDGHALAARMRAYLDPGLSFTDLPNEVSLLTHPWARFEPQRTRDALINTAPFEESKLVRFLAKPLDVRWAYVETAAKLWNEARPDLVRHAEAEVPLLLARRRSPRADDGAPMFFSSLLGDQHSLHTDAYFFPLRVVDAPNHQASLLHAGADTPDASVRPNVSARTRTWLGDIGVDPDEKGEAVWHHALAIGYASRYLDDNADAIRADWPRVPLPKDPELLANSERLGRRLGRLLDVTKSVEGVTDGTSAEPFSTLAVPVRTDGKTMNTAEGDLTVTAGWGHLQRQTVVMPGSGKLTVRRISSDELAALTRADAEELIAPETVDVYLNEYALWCNVPRDVWDFTIGGFQVLKKWLSYREWRVVGRPLTTAEVRQFTSLVRRLAAIVLMSPELNRNYLSVREDAYPWY